MVTNQKQPEGLDTHLTWLKIFQQKNNRPLRVLHIGNTANNAYLVAKIIRQAGIEADVLSYNYYHMMACPEWEEIEIKNGYGGNDNHPNFSKKDLGPYKRPTWFIQGPLDLCIKYIKARDAGKWQQFLLWQMMFLVLKDSNIYKLFHFAKRALRFAKKKIIPVSRSITGMEQVIAEYDRLFPDRIDRLKDEDFVNYLHYNDKFNDLFDRYDIIQSYGIDPILCLLYSKKPYVAFEHGTLRVFTMDDDPLHRLNALAYKKANHVFITNGDCLEYAKKLGMVNFSAMIHPIDVEQHRKPKKETKSDIKTKYQADILLYCPLRHDWEVKGTHVHLEALPLIVKALSSKKVKLLLVSWGQEIDRSKALIKKLGCETNVIWLTPLCRESNVQYMQAADVVLDQMALPCFGATAPQAIAAGTPVIMSYKPESTQWIVEEPAPIISAYTPVDVCNGVLTAIDENWLTDYKKRAYEWTNKEHSSDRVLNSHLQVYRKIIEQDL